MKAQTKWDKLINWFLGLFERYNCRQDRHRWGYLLSESGKVYLDQSKVPEDLWRCLDCHCSKKWFLSESNK